MRDSACLATAESATEWPSPSNVYSKYLHNAANFFEFRFFLCGISRCGQLKQLSHGGWLGDKIEGGDRVWPN